MFRRIPLSRLDIEGMQCEHSICNHKIPPSQIHTYHKDKLNEDFAKIVGLPVERQKIYGAIGARLEELIQPREAGVRGRDCGSTKAYTLRFQRLNILHP